VVYDRGTVNPGGRLILVVEDDASLRLVCRVNLELEGFRVEEAASVAEAHNAAARERPALVVLDLWLGTEDAGGLLDELRGDGLPVVLLSGADDAGDYAGRATEVMGKPFEPMALVAVAQRLTSG
jgi:DNA-binding response OmpR family regulator